MAYEAVFTEQMPFVGSPTQRACVDRAAKKRKVSRAAVIREALDNQFNLVNGQYPEDDPRRTAPESDVPVA